MQSRGYPPLFALFVHMTFRYLFSSEPPVQRAPGRPAAQQRESKDHSLAKGMPFLQKARKWAFHCNWDQAKPKAHRPRPRSLAVGLALIHRRELDPQNKTRVGRLSCHQVLVRTSSARVRAHIAKGENERWQIYSLDT